jgi:hypothetical protein
LRPSPRVAWEISVMAEMLRPMSTGELMDRTFVLYRKNFKLLVGIAMFVPVSYLIFQLLFVGSAALPGATGKQSTAFGMAAVGIGAMAGFVVLMAGAAIAHAATVKAVAALHLGLPITIVGAYKGLKGRIWRILGVFGCMFLLAMLAAIVGVVAIFIIAALIGLAIAAMGVGRLAPGGSGALIAGLIGFGAILLVVLVTAVVWSRYALAIAACVVEDTRVVASLQRSSALSKGSRFRIFIIYVVLCILAAVVVLALGGLAGAFGLLVHNDVIRLIITYVATFIAQALTGPLATIGLALVYYDERVRKEAFDLQWMMSSLDTSAAATPQALPAQS